MDLKLSLAGLLKMQPFEDTQGGQAAAPNAKLYPAIRMLLRVGAGLSVVALLLMLVVTPDAWVLLMFSGFALAIAAGLQWGAGLRAMGLNTLFATLVVNSVGLYVSSGL